MDIFEIQNRIQNLEIVIYTNGKGNEWNMVHGKNTHEWHTDDILVHTCAGKVGRVGGWWDSKVGEVGGQWGGKLGKVGGGRYWGGGKVGKVGEWWSGKVGGSWFYSGVGEKEWVLDFIF